MPGRFDTFLSKAYGSVSKVGRRYTQTSFHKKNMEFVMQNLGLGGHKLGRAIGAGITLYSAYSGFREGGVGGAVGNIATDMAWSYGLRAAGRILAGAANFAVGAATIGLTGWTAYSMATGTPFSNMLSPILRPQQRAFAEKRAILEMGSPTVDQFGTIATMRQRSLAAIQNSKINGRGALGNEAQLMSRSYWR